MRQNIGATQSWKVDSLLPSLEPGGCGSSILCWACGSRRRSAPAIGKSEHRSRFTPADRRDDIVTAYKQLQERNCCLERSNRELQQFASVVAHELQSPLAAIGMVSTSLAEEYDDLLDENAKEYLNYMGKAVQRMNTLLTATLQYSKVEGDCTKPTEQVDSDEVLAWTLLTLSEEIKQCHAVVTSGRLPKLSCREHTLVQLFQNLISNALRYCSPDSSPRIHVSAIRSAVEWTFSVADNGIGIDPANADRIFDLFTRLNANSPGLGIGLSICRKLVHNLGGRIWVESQPGIGSTFRFTIPRSRKGAPKIHGDSVLSSGGVPPSQTAPLHLKKDHA